LADDIKKLTGLKSVDFKTEEQAKKEIRAEEKEAKENIPAMPVNKQKKDL